MIIRNPYYNIRNNMNGSKEWDIQRQFEKSVNLYDRAVVRFGESIQEGMVSFIGRNGINVSTPWGDRFVKWFNVKEIHKT